RQDQFLYQPGVMLSRPKDLETVTRLSTMAFGMFKEQVNDQNGKKRRIERLRKGLATAPDDKEAQDDLKREVDTLRTFRVMVGTDAIPYVPKSLPNFRTMTEAEGDEWVRAQLAVGRDQVSIVIYATNGSLERFEPAFEEHVTDLAQQMNFIPMPKRASETDIAPAAPPATRTKH
ncbi:MAG: hypothetical protein M0R22_11455, partial [Dehalococcoidia bacterium]|nr:hypothetical protein [Dehalococcoidia bacterium]